MAEAHYWVNTVSRDHVRAGVEGGFTQADHGKRTRLERLRMGDMLIFYSPRTAFRGGEVLQAFTALGRVIDNEPYQVEMTSDFHPWRRKVSFKGVKEAPVRPLLEDLTFVTDKRKWGFPFRRGLFEISPQDFERIAKAMGAQVEMPAQLFG